MRAPARVLIQDLLDKTDYVLNLAQPFLKLSDEELMSRTEPHSWSVAECLEHLMLYNDYYLKFVDIELKDKNNVWKTHNTIYKAGLIGNYFAKSMLPNDKGEVKKMSSPKAKNPLFLKVRSEIVRNFLLQQAHLKEVIHKCDIININKGKIPVTILPFVKLSIGDTLRFVTYHNVRHINQAINTLKKIKLSQEL